jgi:hypothetical protein
VLKDENGDEFTSTTNMGIDADEFVLLWSHREDGMEDSIEDDDDDPISDRFEILDL